MELYDIYSFCSSAPIVFFAWLFVLLSVINLYSIIFKKKNSFNDIIKINNFKIKAVCTVLVSLCMAFAILFSNNYFIIKLGCDDIRVMPEGEYCYYVLATNKSNKTYTLPAKISKRFDVYIEEDDTRTQTTYYVEKVYFENGGYLYFEDTCELDYNKNTKVFENSYATDQRERDWQIEFTGRKTYNENIEETEPFKAGKLILPFISVAIIIINMIICLTFKERQKKKLP